jgi:hypothetical protein
MESAPRPQEHTSKKSLENYVIAYIGAYMNTVRKERPEHEPVLARNQPSEVEVALLPNNCFVMLFEKASKQVITVTEKDWGDVEAKVMSGPMHFVAVYAHEGATVADAIARGKRDAVRDIRSIEDSDIAKATKELEKILGALTSAFQENKDILKLGEIDLAKLQPIREAILSSGPEVDMLAMLDSLKNYPPPREPVNMEAQEKLMMGEVVRELGDLSDVIRRVEVADQKLATIEESVKKVVTELNHSIDERINKGLAVLLSSTDKKIDKGFAVLADESKKNAYSELPRDLEVRLEQLEKVAAMVEMEHSKPPPLAPAPAPVIELPKDLEMRLNRLEQVVDTVENQILAKPDLSSELVSAIADLKENISRINSRIIKIEEFLVHVTIRQRVMRQQQEK